jgi:hypothetical protein
MSNAAPSKPGEANPIVQLAILVGILVLVLNAGFYFISEAYFDDRVKRFGAQELARLSGARVDFAIFTVVVGGAAILAALRPRHVAHALAAAAGLASLLAAPFALDISAVLAVTLLTVAGLFEVLIWYSMRRGSRAAWSALAAMCAVYAVVLLFGAPKVRGLLDVGMWIAMIAPGLLAIATAAFAMIRDAYREPAA